ACSIVIVPDSRRTRLTVPPEMFELLALPRHVLGLVPRGSETELILRHAGAATVAPLENEPALTRALETVIAAHFAGKLASVRSWQALNVYDRQIIAQEFAARLDRLCGVAR